MAMATSRTWAMSTAMRLRDNNKGKCRSGRGDGNGNKGNGQQRGQGRQSNDNDNKCDGPCKWTTMATKRAVATSMMAGK